MADQITVVFGEFENDYEDIIGDPPDVPISSSSEVFTDAHLNQGTYNQYVIDTKYTTDTGLRVLPRAASGEDSAILNSVVRTHRGMTDKMIVWTVERRNTKPLIPLLTTNDPNDVPIRQEITFANKYQLAEGNCVYRVSGVNYYKLLRPKMSSDKYAIGTTPAEVAPSSATWYGPEDFSSQIIDGAFASSGGTPVQVRVGS